MDQNLDRNTLRGDWNNSTDGAKHMFSSGTSYDSVTPSDATVLDFNAVYVGGAAAAYKQIRAWIGIGNGV